MNKYEQLIEHIINDETDKARALFHTIVVEKSRDIYESLMDEEDFEHIGGNKVDELVDEVTCDEEGISEDEESEFDDEEFGDEDESDFDYDHDGEINAHEGDHGELEDRVYDLESTLDELQAKFDDLMAGEAEEPEHADMFGHEDDSESDEGSEENTEAFYEGEECDDEEDDEEEELDETLVREYVEKVGEFYKGDLAGAEGKMVGKDGSIAVNKQSITAGKNDMGGTASNIAKGGAEKDPNGSAANKGEMNAYKKGQGELDLGKRNVNQPGGKGADKFYGKKETSWEKNKGPEGKTTSGSVPVNTKSEIGGKVR
jgi:hypothetical protein